MGRTGGRVVVVGGGIGGLRTAENLRALGYTGSIVLISRERGLPYDRPPLSKQVLQGQAGRRDITLVTHDRFDAAGIEFRPGTTAEGVEGACVRTGSGDVEFDALVVATGCRARALPGSGAGPPSGRIHQLRTLTDSIRLRGRLARRGSLVTVGGGFIGAEVASAARDFGCAVTMVEAASAPCAHAVGTGVAEALGDLYRSRGVKLETGAAVTRVDAARRPGGSRPAVSVDLGDGTRLYADDVLIGVGTQPCSQWLPGHDPAGVRCDDRGRALDVPAGLAGRVYAVGDVSRWPTPWGEHRPVGHWTSAVDQARAVAAAIIQAAAPAARAPYFWSDQFGLKLQLAGWVHRAAAVMHYRSPRGRHVSLYVGENGEAVGVLVASDPALAARARQRIAARPPAAALERELALIPSPAITFAWP